MTDPTGITIPQLPTQAIDGLIKAAIILFKGQRVLILGPARSGKTRLYDYLLSKHLDIEGEESSPTTTPNRRRFKNISSGNEKLEVLSISDFPGEDGPKTHALRIHRRRPNVVFVVLDLTTPLAGKWDVSSATWFSDFCKELKQCFSTSNRAAKRIRTFAVLLNKKDKSTKEEIEKHKSHVKKEFLEKLSKHISNSAEKFVIFETQLVIERIEDEDGRPTEQQAKNESQTRSDLERVIGKVVLKTTSRGI